MVRRSRVLSATLGFNVAIAVINTVLSAAAAITLLLAARHSLPELRPVFAGAGVLASIYCGSYFWLIFNLDRAARWSELIRPVGLLSWPIAWIAPAAISMKLFSKLRKAAGKSSKEI